MKRRDFITLVGAATTSWLVEARAEQSERMRRIGVLMGWPESDSEAQAERAAFVHELEKLGWVGGRNLRIDTRWANPADPESMHRYAKELVALQPDLILSHSTPATAALLQETRTIPVIFGIVADPIGSGFVASFPRPGTNATGFAVAEPTQAGKWMELLKEIAPQVTRVAVLFNPAMASFLEFWLKPFKAAAPSFGVEVIEAPVHDTSELESVMAAQAREANSGLFVILDAFAELGGLLSYGEDWTDNFRRAATYADRILKGEKPSDLPVQAPVRFQLVINLKTARALGLDVPPTLLARADEVIE